jgi:hypothetical protein
MQSAMFSFQSSELGPPFATGFAATGGAPYLRIFSQIFEKIRIDHKVIFRGLGEGDSLNKPEAKNLVTLSLLNCRLSIPSDT